MRDFMLFLPCLIFAGLALAAMLTHQSVEAWGTLAGVSGSLGACVLAGKAINAL